MSLTYALHQLPDRPLAELKHVVGGKAANLGVMLGPELRLPVPPGFVISTDVCREALAHGWPDGLDDELRARMSELAAGVGRRFGDPSDPLLVSVRSGAPVSMPGMMDTILNLGLNEPSTAGLAALTGDPAFARACRERLRTTFREIVGLEDVPEDPWQQLRLAIEAVFQSWNSERARSYRQREGIPDDLGTAVTVQAMVFGNLDDASATGVVFTRNPATGAPELFGDVLFRAQGEDVVAGTHRTEPIAVLDERLPAVATELRAAADRLERHYRDLCDIEFTVERGRLWLLQVRVGKRSPQAAIRIAHDLAEDPSFPLSRREAVERVAALLADPPRIQAGRSGVLEPIVTGLGASPGVASGEIATSPDAAVAAVEAGRTVILVRSETSPDDVHGMARAAGILTARGGLASHAAVVARGWGIPAVVGAEGVGIRDGVVTAGGRELREGDVISIDGSTGEVFLGRIEGASEIVPEAREMVGWAAELGIAIGAEAGAGPAVDVRAARPAGRATIEDCLARLATKGFATTAALADALLSDPDPVQRLLDELAADGLVESMAGAWRLSPVGQRRAAEAIAAEREAWGVDRAGAALEAFHALDLRMKDIVTAWQLRPSDSEPVINDHTDAAYDVAVLDRLAALHREADPFLAAHEGACGRLVGYRPRLERALERARAGDGKYVASPRVDSYHGIWFELHEDLIRLAGRTREEEA
ncbi:MAG TPA: pyruvate, phosphate dikinase, partial [Candidatus Limnocylindrales bacterium]|nr:pyruvate, phosphate dikinase [Candidatus Limnocylindrales bacterium]